jgi:hypothetical protein
MLATLAVDDEEWEVRWAAVRRLDPAMHGDVIARNAAWLRALL